MLGASGSDREVLDARALVGHLVAPGSVFAFLADHRRLLFPAEMFADLFPASTGRPSLAPEIAGAVLVLQALERLSDRDTVAAVRCDIRWKVACGLPLDDEGFHPTVLTYWRRRLARSDRPNRIFGAVRQVISQTGALAGKTRRAVDSLVLDDAVATQDTVTQLIAAVRRVIREVPGTAAVAASACQAHDYTDPGKPMIAWDDQAARDALVSALVEDARRLVTALTAADHNETAAQAVALLALVAGQDVEPAPGSDSTDGRWRIARKVAADRVILTVDPEARHVHKTVSQRQDGYKGHVAIEPGTGLFTAGRLTPATGAGNTEAVVALGLLAEEPVGLTVLGDTAYGTGDARAALTAAGHTPIIKPAPLRPAVAAGSPSTTSRWTRTPAPSPARTRSPAGSPPPAPPCSAWPAAPARYAPAAPPARPAASCTSTAMTGCYATPAPTGPATIHSGRIAGNTGPWSNDPSPG